MPRGGTTPLRLDPSRVHRARESTNADVAAGQTPAGELPVPMKSMRSYDFLLLQLELELRPTIVHADIVKKRDAHVAALLALGQPVA